RRRGRKTLGGEDGERRVDELFATLVDTSSGALHGQTGSGPDPRWSGRARPPTVAIDCIGRMSTAKLRPGRRGATSAGAPGPVSLPGRTLGTVAASQSCYRGLVSERPDPSTCTLTDVAPMIVHPRVVAL